MSVCVCRGGVGRGEGVCVYVGSVVWCGVVGCYHKSSYVM